MYRQRGKSGMVLSPRRSLRLPQPGGCMVQAGRIAVINPAPMKEISLLEMIGRSLAKIAAGAGVAALVIWLVYVMLDIGHMQSGFTLPLSSY